MKIYRMLACIFILVLIAGCGKSRSEEIKGLIKDLGSKSRNDQEAARVMLANMGDDAVPSLMKHIKKNKKALVRRNCAIVLAKIGVSEAAEPIRKMLFEAENDKNRAVAAEALVMLEKEKAIADLIKALKNEDAALVRTAIREALTNKKIASTVRQELLPYLKDSNFKIRIEAREAIAKMGRDSIDDLMSLLPTNDKVLIVEVFKALVKIGDTSVLPKMKEAMQPFKEWVDEEKGIVTKFYKNLEHLYNKLYTMR